MKTEAVFRMNRLGTCAVAEKRLSSIRRSRDFQEGIAIMRYLKLLLMLGILAAAAGPVVADTALITVTMNMRNFDEGTLYGVPDGLYTGEAALDLLPQFSPTGGFFNGVQSDTWGIFRVENIQDTDGNYFYIGGPGHEITAIFWGETDTYLNQTTSGTGVITQEIHGVGLKAAFFYDTTPDWSTASVAGPAGWTVDAGVDGQPGVAGVDDDGDTIVDNASELGWVGSDDRPTYAGITDGDLLWTMGSTSGWSQEFPTEDFFATFYSGAASYESHGNLHLDFGTVPGWGTGSQSWGGATLDTDSIPAWNATGTAMDKMTDLLLTFDGTEVGSGDWLLRTSDPMEGAMIPEPVTMAGLMLGLGCLGRYIRNRR